MASHISSSNYDTISKRIDYLISIYNGHKFNVKYGFKEFVEKNPSLFLSTRDPLASWNDFIDSKIKNYNLEKKLSGAPSVPKNNINKRSIGPAPHIKDIADLEKQLAALKLGENKYKVPDITPQELAALEADFAFNSRRKSLLYKSKKTIKSRKSRKSRKTSKSRKSRKTSKSSKSRKTIKSRKSRKTIKSRKSKKTSKTRKSRKTSKSRKSRKTSKSSKSRKTSKSRKSRKGLIKPLK